MSATINYYISTTGKDSNQGTATWPFASLAPVADKLNPGDGVVWMPGLYKLTAPIWCGNSGAVNVPIALQARSSGVILDGSGLPPGKSIFSVGGQYTLINGFQIQNSPNAGVVVWGGGNCSILNSTITNCQKSGIYIGFDSPGVTGNVLVKNNIINNCCLVNAPRATGSGWPAAVTCNLADSVTFSGNSVYYNYGEGIDVNHSSNCQVLSNFLHDNYSANIYLDNAVSPTVNDNFIFSNNDKRFLRSGFPAQGILMANEQAPYSSPLRDGSVIGNTIIGCLNGIAYGAYGAGGGLVRFKIINNETFAQVNAALSIDADPGHIGTTVTGNKFVTNIPNQKLYAWNGGAAGQAGVVDTGNVWFGGMGRGW